HVGRVVTRAPRDPACCCWHVQVVCVLELVDPNGRRVPAKAGELPDVALDADELAGSARTAFAASGQVADVAPDDPVGPRDAKKRLHARPGEAELPAGAVSDLGDPGRADARVEGVGELPAPGIA